MSDTLVSGIRPGLSIGGILTGQWNLVRRSRLAKVGLTIVVLMVIVAVFAPWIAPYNPDRENIRQRVQPPSLTHVFGTDDFGRDVLARVIFGSRISLEVGAIAVGISMVAGTTLGAIGGYHGGYVDEIIGRLLDILFAFPAILLAIAIMGALGAGIGNAMIAIGIVYTPIFARIVRASFVQIREESFVEAARGVGASDARIIWRHILPNALGPLLVETTLSLAFAILAEAALSFLGLGTPPPTPSWGRMLSEARDYMELAPWMSIFPGIAIMLTVIGFNFLGDGIRDSLDPRLQRLLQPGSSDQS